MAMGQETGGGQSPAWGEGVTHTATGPLDGGLCSDAFIHFYRDPILAVMMDPIHANFGSSAKLWEAEATGAVLHEPLKSGSRSLTTIHEIPLPVVTTAQRVKFAQLCAAAARAAKAAAYAAWAAAAWTDAAAYAAARTDYAAWAAARASTAVADASAAAADANPKIDFIALAHKAMEGDDKGE